MKFEMQKNNLLFEVGFFKPSGAWVCLKAYATAHEAEAEVSRLVGGNRDRL